MLKRSYLIGATKLLVSATVQITGSFFILRPQHIKPNRTKSASYLLLIFLVLQPILYGAMSDMIFMGHSIAHFGGLMLLVWSEMSLETRRGLASSGLAIESERQERDFLTLPLSTLPLSPSKRSTRIEFPSHYPLPTLAPTATCARQYLPDLWQARRADLVQLGGRVMLTCVFFIHPLQTAFTDKSLLEVLGCSLLILLR